MQPIGHELAEPTGTKGGNKPTKPACDKKLSEPTSASSGSGPEAKELDDHKPVEPSCAKGDAETTDLPVMDRDTLLNYEDSWASTFLCHLLERTQLRRSCCC